MYLSRIEHIYKTLLKFYGRQGWWPLGGGVEYRPGNYISPKTETEQYEIILGAVLTQNTSWTNVQPALQNIINNKLCSPDSVLDLPVNELAKLIKSSGYFNQKAKKLKIIAEFLLRTGSLKDGVPPGRDDLLSLWGIGPETADSILLYAFNVPVFVIDAYTRRIFSRLGIISADLKYDGIQELFMKQCSGRVEMMNEYHALIVKHAKEFCKKNPVCENCPLESGCSYHSI